MRFKKIETIADAVLYEGYILYPYRPSSIKNQQRWNFGTLFPKGFVEAQNAREAWCFRAEVVLQGDEDRLGEETSIDARVRFLHLVPANGAEHGWDEGFARSRTVEGVTLAQICSGVTYDFNFDELTEEEQLKAPPAFSTRGCRGRLKMSADRLSKGVYRLHAVFTNETQLSNTENASRKLAQAISFTSAHLLLHVQDGSFVSALDPASELMDAVAGCKNQGVFPVLAGDDGDRSYMLCSPIILYDYPRIAPESTGDFFDGTEMDEMLALRVMTLTDEEQEEMRRSDPHARAILERMETLPKEHLLKVHGAVRGLRSAAETGAAEPDATAPETGGIDGSIQPWNPFEERPPVEVVHVFGVPLRRGDRVRLWPQKKADIMDMAMEGKTAVIESIVEDLEDNIQLAVVLDDDPGKDLGLLQKAGHRFFFSPNELEPLNVEAL